MSNTRPAGGGVSSAGTGAQARVVVVGSGFAGFHAARTLERLLPDGAAQVTLVSPADYLLYSPLLPQVAAGVLDPRHVAVPLAQTLRRTTPMLGLVVAADLDERTVTVEMPDGAVRELGWDRLVLCPGSVTREFSVPGLDEHARGFKSLAEAIYLRDHVLQQLEMADVTDDPDERRARCTFVVVGAGYSGTEFTAQMEHFVAGALPRYPHLRAADVRWVLATAGPAVMPELGPDLGHLTLQTLQRRGIDVRLKTTVRQIRPAAVTLSDGSEVATRTVVWTAGVTPSPLVGVLARQHDLQLQKGRLIVDADLCLPGHEGVWALGDAAAVPDLTRPGSVTPPTAQHAQRQGKAVARNVAASLGVGRARPYKHHDLGLVVDLAGRNAVATPLRLPLAGLPAKAVTFGYHLWAVPSGNNRARIVADWLLDAALPRPATQLGYVPESAVGLPAEERTDVYDAFRGTAASATTPVQRAAAAYPPSG